MEKFRACMFALAAVGAALCATSAIAAKDKFNRATLGEKWKLVKPGPGDGDLFISNNQLRGTVGKWSYGSFKKSKNDNSVSATFTLDGSPDDQAGAIIVGTLHSGDNSDNAFVEIAQWNDTGVSFDHGTFYTGQSSGGPGTVFSLTSPVPSPAKVTVTVCGTVAKMTIKSAAPTQIYTFDYGVAHGTGGGLATFKTIIDDFKSEAASCKAFSEGSIVIRASNAKDRSKQERTGAGQ